jgi:hypothetical protein
VHARLVAHRRAAQQPRFLLDQPHAAEAARAAQVAGDGGAVEAAADHQRLDRRVGVGAAGHGVRSGRSAGRRAAAFGGAACDGDAAGSSTFEALAPRDAGAGELARDVVRRPAAGPARPCAPRIPDDEQHQRDQEEHARLHERQRHPARRDVGLEQRHRDHVQRVGDVGARAEQAERGHDPHRRMRGRHQQARGARGVLAQPRPRRLAPRHRVVELGAREAAGRGQEPVGRHRLLVLQHVVDHPAADQPEAAGLLGQVDAGHLQVQPPEHPFGQRVERRQPARRPVGRQHDVGPRDGPLQHGRDEVQVVVQRVGDHDVVAQRALDARPGRGVLVDRLHQRVDLHVGQTVGADQPLQHAQAVVAGAVVHHDQLEIGDQRRQHRDEPRSAGSIAADWSRRGRTTDRNTEWGTMARRRPWRGRFYRPSRRPPGRARRGTTRCPR